MELDLNTFLAIVGLAIAIILAVVGGCWKMASTLSKIHKSVCTIGTDIKELKGGLVDTLTSKITLSEYLVTTVAATAVH